MAVYNVSSPLQLVPPPQGQVTVLELFFPGFTRVSSLVQQYTAIDLDVLFPLLCLCGMGVFAWKQGYGRLWNWIQSYFTSTVHVSCNDEVYKMLISWVSQQPFAKHSRSSLASVDLGGRVDSLDSDGSRKKSLHYAPWNGCFQFWYKNRPLKFRRVEKTGESLWYSREKEEVSISCLGWSSQVLKDLLEECRQMYLGRVQSKTLIYENRNGRWKQSRERDIRPISTVLYDEKEKESLLNDVQDFLDPGMRRWYAKRGIPYRRGYLLSGPPGTGKSSLSLSVAGYFHLDIYILKLASVDEDDLNDLFAELPQRCMVLLEDIDAAAPNRAHDSVVGDLKSVSAQAGKIQRKRVTLSGLLNALDGVASQEGRVLVMTTNYLERLDEALIRPGRVDRMIEFSLANKDIIGRLFCNIFSECDGCDEKTVKRLASDFAGQVPESEFSPAEVLSHLLEHRLSPADAVANVEAWVTREQKRKKLKRGDSWEDAA